MTIAPNQYAEAEDILEALANTHTVTTSGQFYQDSGASVIRYNDRLFLGAATDNPALKANTLVGTDWLSSVMGATSIGAWSVYGSTTASISRVGAIGLLGASRTSDGRLSTTLLGYNPSSIGVAAWAIDDDTSSPRTQTAYAFYGEVWRMPGVNYEPSFAMELECVNLGGAATGESTPYHVNCGGGTYAIQLGSGGGQTAGTSNAEAGITFVNNPNTFNVGIIFEATALAGTDGETGGYGSAMQLAAYQGIEWKTPETVQNVKGANSGAFIRSVVTVAAQGGRLEFQNGYAAFANAEGQTTFAIQNVPNVTNTLTVEGGVGQQAAGLYVEQGSNGSANLGLYPAQGGELQISSPVSNVGGNVAVTNGTVVAGGGYLHININGVDYRIALLTPTQAGG